MPSSVIYWLHQIVLAEGHPSLITFYYCKVNPVGDDDTNVAGVYEAPDITVVYEDTDEDPQDDYYTTYVDIGQCEQEYHKEDHNYHEHNNDNLDPPQYNNHDYPR